MVVPCNPYYLYRRSHWDSYGFNACYILALLVTKTRSYLLKGRRISSIESKQIYVYLIECFDVVAGASGAGALPKE